VSGVLHTWLLIGGALVFWLVVAWVIGVVIGRAARDGEGK
jgi:hypothetical protein